MPGGASTGYRTPQNPKILRWVVGPVDQGLTVRYTNIPNKV